MQPAAQRSGTAISADNSCGAGSSFESGESGSASNESEEPGTASNEPQTPLNQGVDTLSRDQHFGSVSPDWVSQSKSITTLEQALHVLANGDFHGRWELVKKFPGLGRDAISPLIEIAQDDRSDTECRWFAIRILGRFAEPEAITALGDLVSTVDNDDLSILAAEQLAGLGNQAISALVPLLELPSERALAVKALGQIRQRAVIEPLLNVLTDANPRIRQTALEALGSFHDQRVTTALLQALTDPSSRVRKEAVISLGHRHDLCQQPAVLKPLEQCLWDVEIDVCCEAAVAIGRLRLFQSMPALEKLVASSHNPDPLLLCVVRALSWFDTVAAQSALIVHYPQLTPTVQLEIVRRLGHMTTAPRRATQFLLEVLQQQPGVNIKQAAALSLGQLGDKTAFHALVPLLADANRQVQFHCLRALEQLAPNDLEADLEAVLNSNVLSASIQTRIEAHLSEW